jgi:hypothetical protein
VVLKAALAISRDFTSIIARPYKKIVVIRILEGDMAGKSDYLCNGLLQLIFNGVELAGLAMNDTSPLYTFYIALHTADPTAAGNQNSYEISYTGYARIGILRSSAGFVISGNSVSPVDLVAFTASSGGAGGTATFWSVGTDSTGAGNILYSGPLSPPIIVSVGVTPEITQSSTITEA